MTREELLHNQPWHVIAQWWFLTFIGLLWILPMMLLLMANPLWFRKEGLNWIVRHTGEVARLRDTLLQSQFDKYRLFDILAKEYKK